MESYYLPLNGSQVRKALRAAMNSFRCRHIINNTLSALRLRPSEHTRVVSISALRMRALEVQVEVTHVYLLRDRCKWCSLISCDEQITTLGLRNTFNTEHSCRNINGVYEIELKTDSNYPGASYFWSANIDCVKRRSWIMANRWECWQHVYYTKFD